MEFLQRTVNQVARSGAITEAGAFVKHALHLLQSLPDKDSPARQAQELDFQNIIHRDWLINGIQEILEAKKPPHMKRMRNLVDQDLDQDSPQVFPCHSTALPRQPSALCVEETHDGSGKSIWA